MIRRFGNKVKKQWRRTPNKEIYYIKKSCKFKALQEAGELIEVKILTERLL